MSLLPIYYDPESCNNSTAYTPVLYIHKKKIHPLHEIPAKRLSFCRSLEICDPNSTGWLYLTRKNFTEFPPEILDLQHLYKLDLANNKITVIPPEIHRLSRLAWLVLSFNTIKTLPDLPPMLKHLLIDHNDLEALPERLEVNLRRIHAQWNRIVRIPPQIGDLLNLQVLNLSHNQLESVPTELYTLTLKVLNLSHNRLEIVSPEMAKLSWTQIDLSHNQLTTLPVECYANQEFPRLEGNPILFLPTSLLITAPETYKKYTFHLQEDIHRIKSLISPYLCKSAGEMYNKLIPIQKTLIKRAIYIYFVRYYPEDIDHEDHNFAETIFQKNPEDRKIQKALSFLVKKLEGLQMLQRASEQSNNKEKKLWQLILMMHFPLDQILFEQQIIEAIFETFKGLPQNSDFLRVIDQAICPCNPTKFEGIRMFVRHSLDLEMRKKVTLLYHPRVKLERDFITAITQPSIKERLLAISELFDDVKTNFLITASIETLPKEIQEKIKHGVHTLTEGKNGDHIVFNNPKDSLELKKTITKIANSL